MAGTEFGSKPEQHTRRTGFENRVRANQRKLTTELKSHYDFIVCGSGPSGSVVARRLAENAKVGVLLAKPKSRGRICLTGVNPRDPIAIEANTLAHPEDMKAATACVELCREIGNSAPLSSFVKREVMPGNLKGAALENFIRDAASTYWHQTCTAKMGHDEMSVVDGYLKVHDIGHPRIADGSIMPRITTGNTMAPCVVIGKRAAEILKVANGA